ncbi:MAG: MFS transporter [Chloroflexota bacterium]|nr:MFS transporter [Chloroflexota bacterium]
MSYNVNRAILGAKEFIARQKHNYRVGVTRSAANSFLINLTSQYSSIYTTELGANSVQLGTVNAIGRGVNALVSTPVGWLIDRYGLKRLYLLGMMLRMGGVLVYALAPDWRFLVIGTVLFYISMRLTGTGCSVICADSVENRDRVTAQNLCVTLSSIVSLIAPLIAAHLITLFGGLNAQGIRPLFYIRLTGHLLIFLFVAAELREPERVRVDAQVDPDFIGDFRALLRAGGHLRRWILVSSLRALPMAMTSPFIWVFAKEMKGADQYLIGIMTMAPSLLRILLGIPIGRMADRIGRKKVIYLLTPLWYASSLLFVFSPNSATLVLAATLQMFFFISSGIASAMSIEMLPVEQVGRWSGVLGLFQGLFTIPAPILGGLIWRELRPRYVFLIPLAIDLLFGIPLLTTIPETLGPGDEDAD